MSEYIPPVVMSWTEEEIKALLDSTRQQIADQGRMVDDRLLRKVKMLERALEENEDE